MRYSVCASALIDTLGGPLEEPVKPVDAGTKEKAIKIAKELYGTGKYSSIYIEYNHPDSSCFYNPIGGFDVTGQDWVEQFEFEKNYGGIG
ncbi:hypothetical protein [Paenibacillus sp. DRB1-1]|uniref:hypothetical protein n=1 Tax=Paenibacillus sp. DRB1-1 TaxID=3422309 RepID=UPI003F95346A